MIHYQHLQMLASSGFVSPLCSSNVHDCCSRKGFGTAGHHGSALNPPHRRRHESTSLSSPRSVSSWSYNSNGSNAGQLGSLLLTRLESCAVRELGSRKSSRVYRRRLQVCRSNVSLSGPLSGGFWEEKSDGQKGVAERKNLLSSRFGSRTRRLVAAQAAAAGASAPPAPQNFFAKLWAKFIAICVSFSSKLQSIRIGRLDLLTMLRVVFIVAGAFGAYVASRIAWAKIQEKANGKSEGGGAGGDSDPMKILARGATCFQSNMGPWSITDMTIGLTAMAKVTVKKPPALPGKEVNDLSKDPNFLLRAQHWRGLSEAVYAKDSASFSLFSNLPESSLVASSWEPDQETFRPAYAVFLDVPYGAVVLSVRGTSHIIDMLLNSGTAPEPFGDDGNFAHGGFVHASKVLYEEVVPHIEKAFKNYTGTEKEPKLVIVGHSMGAAVGALISLQLRDQWPDLRCWGFCPPACMSLDLAKECKSFTTSFVSAHDLVPRFSLNSVEKLRTRIQEFDWDEVESVAKDDEDWQNIKKAMETFKGLQEKQRNIIEGVTGGSGSGNSQTAEKVQGMVEKVMGSETAGKVGEWTKSIGSQSEDDGKNNESQKEEGDEDESCSPPPLHPPGRLLIMGSDPPGCGKMPEQRGNVASERNYGAYPTFDEMKNVTWRMSEAQQEDMEEIIVSPWLVSDHMLGNICEGIGYFQSHCSGAVK